MKIILSILLLAGSAWGQAVVFTTNDVLYPDNFRMVRGKLYNINKSTNWLWLEGRCADFHTNGIVFKTDSYANPISGDGLTSGGNFLGSSSRPAESPPPHIPWGTYILIQNYPTNKTATVGDRLTGKVMRVGLARVNDGQQMQVYDWGTPCIVKIVRTNSLSKTKPPH